MTTKIKIRKYKYDDTNTEIRLRKNPGSFMFVVEQKSKKCEKCGKRDNFQYTVIFLKHYEVLKLINALNKEMGLKV